MFHWNLKSDDLPPSLRHCAAAVGNFDGVHLGHAEILRRLKSFGLPTVVFTFSEHPRQILRPEDAPPLLTANERKAELIQEQGIDEVIFCPTARILNWPAEAFFQRVIVELLDAKILVEGPNFRFGYGGRGNTDLLADLCAQTGRKLEIVEILHEADGVSVSSSRIRDLISEGEIPEANALLTAPYRLTGTVIHGEARGRSMGFPTANLGNIQTILPAFGVYACRAILADGRACPAAVSIGPNVTFGGTDPKVEVFLLDFHGLIYAQTLHLEFIARLRDLVTFQSREELMAQIEKDVEKTREMLMNDES